jgi:hypothetical protein
MSDETSPQDVLSYESPRWVTMPAVEIGVLALRLMGVWQAVGVIASLAYLPAVLWQQSNSPLGSMGSVALYFGWNVAIVATLLGGARPIARIVFGRQDVAARELGLAAWGTLIVAGVGLFIAGSAVDDLLRIVQVRGVAIATLSRADQLSFVPPLVTIAIGLTMFLKPSLIAGPWLRRVTRER